MRSLLRWIWSAILCLACATRVLCATETVKVVKVFQNDDKGIIERANGERWIIKKGTGALGFWRREGKDILIHSPASFCGAGAKLIIPDLDQEARIWSAELLSPASDAVARRSTGKVAPARPPDTRMLATSVTALTRLNYFDPQSEADEKRDPVEALGRFKTANKVEEVGIGPKTLAKLAELVLKKEGAEEAGLELAQNLIGFARDLASAGTVSTSETALPEKETFITQVSGDGEIVKLADGSVHEVDSLGRIKSMLWLPTQSVLRRDGKLLNLSSGEQVGAQLLK